MAGRRLKRRVPLRAEFDDRRIAAFKIVYAAIEATLGQGRNPYDAWALSAASEAVLKHPNAGDEQIMDFLRWFAGDGNPMP